MDCCKNDLGEFAHNKDIDTGIEAGTSGLYELMFTGPGFSKFSKYYHFEAGSSIIIPAGILNEDFTYKLVITDPSGNAVSVNSCSNFSLKTFVNVVSCDDTVYL